MRFLIIDDHPLLRMGVRHLLEIHWPDAEVLEAETLAAGLIALQGSQPDAVLLDLNLPDAEGIEGAARLVRLAPDVPVLVLSQGDEAALAGRLLQLGVRGYLPKDRAVSELPHALGRILAGQRYVTPEQADRLVDLLDAGSGLSGLPHEVLSIQEFRVMQLIAAGQAPAQIAQTMHLSVKTVGSYRARVLQKTGWRSNSELTKYCVAHGLTDASGG